MYLFLINGFSPYVGLTCILEVCTAAELVVHATFTKAICQQTERATKDPRSPITYPEKAKLSSRL